MIQRVIHVMKIAVFGTGYVGCVTAACLARDGHHVVGVDIDTFKVARINGGESPVEEPGLGQLIAQCVAAGRLRATTDAAEAVADTELALITVGTPSGPDGSVSTAAVLRVVEAIGAALRKLRKPYGVVVRSTLLPGVLEEHVVPALMRAIEPAFPGEEYPETVWVANNPEFLRETTAIRDYDEPPFIVVGADEPWQAEVVFDLYRGIDAPRYATDTRTAALVKYACNAFHAVKVAFANEIGALARALGADGHTVMELLCEDRKLNISPAYLKPGFAFGGSCLPKDLRALVRCAELHAVRLPMLAAVLPSNEEHLHRAIRMVRAHDVRRIGLVGLSFKAGTDDLRESPQVALAETLIGKGYELRIWDPHVHVARLRGQNRAYIDRHLPHLAALLVERPEELLEHAELLILATGVADGLELNGFAGPVLDLRTDLCRASHGLDGMSRSSLRGSDMRLGGDASAVTAARRAARP